MKKIVIVCGLVAGTITTGWTLGAIAFMSDLNFDNGMFYGFASMILAFSLIFVGIKTYRDKHNNGLISFGKAFRIGLYISLIASTMYVIGWVIAYFNFIPDFDERYTEHVLNAMREKGESQEAIERQSRDMAAMWENYQNPFFCAMITYTEILPVGLLISLIAALILKRKVARAEVATP